jgi:hypothetical protein
MSEISGNVSYRSGNAERENYVSSYLNEVATAANQATENISYSKTLRAPAARKFTSVVPELLHFADYVVCHCALHGTP